MAKRCSLCHKELSGFAGMRIKDGLICKECKAQLPVSITQPQLYDSRTLQSIINMVQDATLRQFEATASYGNLHVDELHGLFAISDKLDSNSYPVNTNDIFNVLMLQDIALYCTNPAVSSKNRVVCDVEFQCTFATPPFHIKLSVKKKIPCRQIPVDQTHVNWDEPGDLLMFKSIFNQMIKTAREKYTEQYQQQLLKPGDIARFKAETLFMLPDGYTMKDIDQQWNTLSAAFRADIGRNHECLHVINEAYHVLRECCKQKAKEAS